MFSGNGFKNGFTIFSDKIFGFCSLPGRLSM